MPPGSIAGQQILTSIHCQRAAHERGMKQPGIISGNIKHLVMAVTADRRERHIHGLDFDYIIEGAGKLPRMISKARSVSKN